MNTKFLSRALALTCAVTAMATMTGCRDVVIKVEKKSKNVDLSAIENFNSLNLQNSEDFLKHLDNLKVVGVDMLMKQLASRDYRSEVRTAIRNYRKFLIERAKGNVQVDDSFDSFYNSADKCRTSGLNFNMDQANDFLGIILKTAVLAKLSEVNAPKLNPGISKEVAAIGQLIMVELGLKVDGTVDVQDLDGVTKTVGTMKLSLAEIAGETIDEATKKADKTEVLSMDFTRLLGDNYTGSFDAIIGIDHEVSAGVTETLQGKLGVERLAKGDKFLHTIGFELGVKDGPVHYARTMMFEQVAGESKQVKVTDTVARGLNTEKTYATIIDVGAGTQCKVGPVTRVTESKGNGGNGGKGDEGGFVGDDKGTNDTGDDSTETPKGDDDITKSDDNGKPDDSDKNDDDQTKGGDDVVVTIGPTQNPGQHPGQNPGQSPIQSK